jgi:hypothetical protein
MKKMILGSLWAFAVLGIILAGCNTAGTPPENVENEDIEITIHKPGTDENDLSPWSVIAADTTNRGWAYSLADQGILDLSKYTFIQLVVTFYDTAGDPLTAVEDGRAQFILTNTGADGSWDNPLYRCYNLKNGTPFTAAINADNGNTGVPNTFAVMLSSDEGSYPGDGEIGYIKVDSIKFVVPKADDVIWGVSHWNAANERLAESAEWINDFSPSSSSPLIKPEDADNFYIFSASDINTNGATVTQDPKGGAHVHWDKNYGHILFPFPVEDTGFMQKVTKVILIVETDYADLKKISVKLTSNTEDNYGTSGEYEIAGAVQYRDYSSSGVENTSVGLWSTEKRVLVYYFNGDSNQLPALNANADTVAFALANNESSGPLWTDFTIKAILFAQ